MYLCDQGRGTDREGFEEDMTDGLMVELEHRDILDGRVAFTREQGWDKVCM